MREQSHHFENLYVLDNCADLAQHALALAELGRRQIRILSRQLDPALYDTKTFCAALSEIARRHPSCDVQILIKDSKPLVEKGHQVIRLAQRLPSKVKVRRLCQESDAELTHKKNHAFMLVDLDKLLYLNNETDYQGFANYAAGPEVRSLKALFERLWQTSEADPNLRSLNI